MKNFPLLTTIMIVLTLLPPVQARGADYPDETANYITISNQNGMASNNVYDICTDKNGCVWLATSIGLSRYDGSTVTNHFKEEMNIRSNFINYVFYDSKDRVWIGSTNGVAIYDVNTEKFSPLELVSGSTIENKTAWFFEDSEGTIWISFKSHGFISVNPETFKIKQYFQNKGSEDYFSRIWFEPENGLYLLAHIDGGLFYVDLKTERITPFSPSDNPEYQPFADKKIKGMLKTDEQTFCLTCTDGTMFFVNPYTRSYESVVPSFPQDIRNEFKRATAISDNLIAMILNKGFVVYDVKKREFVKDDIYSKPFRNKSLHCIAGDITNGLIIGSIKHGASIQQDRGFAFKSIRKDPTGNITLNNSNVSGFAESADTSIYISTRLKGAFIYNPSTDRIRRLSNTVIPEKLNGVASVGTTVWFASPFGIYRFDTVTGIADSYMEGCGNNYMISAYSDGAVAVLSENGLLQYDENSDTFSLIPAFTDLTVRSISPGKDGFLIVSTAEKGIIRWNGKEIRDIHRKRMHKEPVSSKYTIIHEDIFSRIWAVGQNGSCTIFSSKESRHKISTRSGLPSDIITNIISDNDGNIIITTDRSLTMIPLSGKMYSITKQDGLLNFGFSKNAALKTSSGEILIGSKDGITVIPHHKSHYTANNKTLKIAKVTSGDEEIALKGNKITLNYRHNTFDIDITDIDPHHLRSGRSMYCLEGYNETWAPASENGKISFISIKPGKYVFRSYDSSIEPLLIKIRPHPLCSGFAVFLYIICGLSLMGSIFIYIRNNEIRKRKAETLQLENNLHREKIDFFTNIAHEIKTPLTLITTPLNHIKSNTSIDDDARFDIEVMDKHAKYLTGLIKELLEFSKIEKRKYSIQCCPTDICKPAENVITNFAEQFPDIRWDISIPKDEIWAMADTSALIKILNNLVFNATKYTDSFIQVSLYKENGNAVISICNDGDIIPEDAREKIFQSFVRYSSQRNNSSKNCLKKEGFGIGLSVARSLAELQGGTLRMDPDSKYNSFILKLPLSDCQVTNTCTERIPEDKQWKDYDISENLIGTKEHTILVVDDNKDLLDYLRKTFSPYFKVLTAECGEEAMETISNQTNIDLVITDQKMPGITGIELCSTIKKNTQYSHIIVIVLSANLTPETKIKCLEEGANGIVEKPFEMDYLLSMTKNFINARKKLIRSITEELNSGQDKETDSKDKETSGAGLSAREILLLRQINETIVKNHSNPEFGVDELAEMLNISKSTLNRKMKDILNTSTNNYIRDIRLKQAEDLLKTSSMQINEICYTVGFQTPSYFIKCFKKKYGKSPNEYANTRDDSI